jgi:hypothetical protein
MANIPTNYLVVKKGATVPEDTLLVQEVTGIIKGVNKDIQFDTVEVGLYKATETTKLFHFAVALQGEVVWSIRWLAPDTPYEGAVILIKFDPG